MFKYPVINLNRILWCIKLPLVVFSFAIADYPRTNSELLDEVMVNLMEPVMHHIPAGEKLHLIVHFQGYRWYVDHRISEILQNKGYKIAVNSLNDNRQNIIEIGVESLFIEYEELFRKSLFGKRYIKRNAIARVSLSITKRGEKLTFRSEETISDEVPFREIDYIENSALPFTMGTLPDGNVIDRYVGPIVIIGTAAVVVYLFFTMRS